MKRYQRRDLVARTQKLEIYLQHDTFKLGNLLFFSLPLMASAMNLYRATYILASSNFLFSKSSSPLPAYSERNAYLDYEIFFFEISHRTRSVSIEEKKWKITKYKIFHGKEIFSHGYSESSLKRQFFVHRLLYTEDNSER